MGTVFTGQISYAGRDRLDITVKSGCGSVLAPTWNLVGGLKQWRRYEPLTLEDYTVRYYDLLRHRYQATKQPFLDILAAEQVVLLCYCHKTFCHRHLAVDILEKIALAHDLPFTRGGEL